MATFTCDRYPSLRILLGDGRSVKFTDGTAEVPDADKDAVAALKAHDDVQAAAARPVKK